MAVSSEVVSRYQAFFVGLTDSNVDGYRDLTADTVRYRDPLMDSKGIDAVLASMHKWFADMVEIDFQMTTHAVNENVLFQNWIMHFRIKKLPKRLWELDGVSKVTFNDDGKVVDHIDYWDASPIFESVPMLGSVVKIIRKMFS